MSTSVDDWYHPCNKCGKATSWTCDTIPPKSEQCSCHSDTPDFQTQLNNLARTISDLARKIQELETKIKKLKAK
jgi:predicted RNase H-like nuclease (RuvC/YqgF family)